MKTSRNDIFDLKLCIRGLGNVLTYMHSDTYEFMYYLIFMRSLRVYKDEFNHAWGHHIADVKFFENTTDPYVKICFSTELKLIECKLELIKRWGMNEEDDLNDASIRLEADRWKPYRSVYKRSKSYKKLSHSFVRSLTGYIDCLYIYACAIMTKSYKVPRLLRMQLYQPGEMSLRFLHEEDNNVALLKALIVKLQKDLSDYQMLIADRERIALIARHKRDAKKDRTLLPK